MMRQRRFISLVEIFLLFLSLCFSQNVAEVPGIIGRVNSRGIEVVKDEFLRIIQSSIEIPDISGRSSGINYNFKNLEVDRFDVSDASLMTIPSNTLRIRINDATLALNGDFKLSRRVKIFFTSRTFTGRGSFRASLSGLTISQAVTLGKTSQGKPQVTPAACTASIRKLSISLRGGAIHKLINLGLKAANSVVRRAFQNLICPAVRTLINDHLNPDLKAFNVFLAVPLDTGIDFGFVRPPRTGLNQIEFAVSGRCFPRSNPRKRYDIATVPINPLRPSRRMFQTRVSPYVLNTYLASIEQQGYFIHHIDPAEVRNALNFDLSTAILAFIMPSLLPHVGRPLRFLSEFHNPPTILLAEGFIDLFGYYDLKAQVVLEDNTFINAFTVRLSINARGRLNARQNVISGRFHELNTTIVDSGNLPSPLLKPLTGDLLENNLLSKINELTAAGFSPPSLYNFHLRGVELTMKEDSIDIEADLYSG